MSREGDFVFHVDFEAAPTDTNEVFFCFLKLEAHNLGTLQALQIKILLGSSILRVYFDIKLSFGMIF